MPSPDDCREDAVPTASDDSHPARVVYSETAEVRIREDGSVRVVPITDASKPAVPDNLRQTWRDSLDTLTEDFNVTAAVIIRITRDGLRVLVSSSNPENPYHEDRLSPLGDGRYCETVIGTGVPFSVSDAGSSSVWHDSPDSALGIQSYYGVPIHWSDGSSFGSLCILDRKPQISETAFESQVDAVRSSVEHDLETLLQSTSQNSTASSADTTDVMFRYTPGGIFSYSAEKDERFSFISVNMLSFLGYTEEEFREKFENRFSRMVWYEDRERVLAEIDEQISHGSFDTCEYRIEKKDGELVWVHDEGHIVTDENGKRWFFVVIVDITGTIDVQERLAKRNRELEEIVNTRQSTLDDIPGGIRVFVKRDGDIVCLNANQYYADMIGIDKDELIGESFGQNAKRIHPDDRERHKTDTVKNLDLYRISEGTYRFLNARTGEYRWYHVEAALRSQPDGTDLAYFHYTDVDDLKRAEDEVQQAQKQEQARFHQSIQSILLANPAALCTFQVNLTKDISYEGHGMSPFILKTLRSDTASGLFDRCLEIIPYEKDRQLFHSVFNLDALISGFDDGKVNRHIDYRRTDADGKICWVRTFVSLLKNPESGDVEGAIYSIDISHEKRRDDVFEMLTGEEYELIALLDLDTGKVEAFHISDSLPQSYRTIFREVGDACDFDWMRENCIQSWVAPDDRQKYVDGTNITTIQHVLDRDGRYELTVKGQLSDNEVVYRKLQHYYLDDEKREVLIANSDVTQSYLEQQREMEEKRQGQLERTLVDTVNSLPASSVLFRIQNDHTITLDRYSDEFCRMGGFDRGEELFRDNVYVGVHPDDIDRVMETIDDHLDDDVPFSSVYRIITKSGDYIWVSVNFIRFNLGDTKYLYAVYTDIDEVKRQERQLSEQYDAAQEYLDSVASTYLSTGRVNLSRNIIEESSNGIPALPEGGQQSFDGYVELLLGNIVSESDRDVCARTLDRKALIDAYRRGERTCAVVFRMRSTGGEIRWVKVSLNLTKHPGTGDIILFSAASDVTQEELTKAIMDGVLPRQYDYISCIDARRDEVVLFVSGNELLSGLGISTGAGFRNSEREYCEKYVTAGDRERYMRFTSLENIVSNLQDGKRYVDSFSIDEGTGPRVAQVEFFYIDQESGLIGTSRTDITDAQKRQIEQEEALRKALASAESANAAKSEFLSRMSHDMRTPLNGIIGMTYLTEEMEMPDEARENLAKIDTSSKFLLGLINDILDMTKAESNEIDLHLEPYPPREFYEYLDAVIKPLCEGKHQNFIIHANPPEDIIPLFDKLRINQIIFNLLSNAVKFTPEGGSITYDAHFGERDEQGRIPVHIMISDTGIGMTDGFQQVLFEPFTQETRADISEIQGTGLGLSIVKKLVMLMGGTISVKSAVGSGTTFTIDMTVDSVSADEIPNSTVAGGGQSGSKSLVGSHILLCEDHPLNQEIAVALLTEKGAKVEVADNGQRGVDLFAKSSVGFFDVVLMDIRMPVMDGYQAARHIRDLDRADAATVPIVAMTADAFADDVQRCLDEGMNGHIAKPIDPQALYDALERVLS